jgi:hypothetical protein
MSRSVKISENLYEAAKVEAKKERRTIEAQVEFWIKVGRAAIDNPDLPASFIADSLASLSETRPGMRFEYKLTELLATWNSEMNSVEDAQWLDMKPIGKEIW